MKKGKQAQGMVKNLIVGILVFIVVVAIGITIFQDRGFGQFGESVTDAVSIIMQVFGPLFNVLLDLNGVNVANQFLVVMSFILISIIIVGTLDSVNIFGDDGKGNLINFFVGVIVAIIGVRFMPADLWSSLTAPSSAFVAAILMGIPLMALFFITMKMKYTALSKLMWIFYIVFDIYLLTSLSATGGIMTVYLIILVLSGLMLFFDSEVRKFFYKEKSKTEIADLIGKINIKQRLKIRQEIQDMQEIIATPSSPKRDKVAAEAYLAGLTKKYGDITEI